MTNSTHLNPDRRFLLEHIHFDKYVKRAKGHYLYTEDDTAYLDFLAQYGAVPFGHNPDAIWSTIKQIEQQQAPALVQPLLSRGAEQLARELIEVAPKNLAYVTFTNSGAESVEAAIKLSRAHTKRSGILSTHSGFHGKTLGAVSATGNPIYNEPFLTDTTEFEHVPFNDLDALQECLQNRKFAAFIVEVVQGEGGMQTSEPGYLSGARELCHRYGTLLILDEVQTGFGRTGRLFACEHEQIEPDILLLAKALGGGLVPIGACLCTKKVWSKEFGYYHSSTFANNHLTCSVGLATLRTLTGNDGALIRQVEQRGKMLRSGLEQLVSEFPDVFTEVRGLGLMQGLYLATWNSDTSYFMNQVSYSGNAVPLLCGYLLNEHKILTAPVFNNSQVLRIEPSLTITKSEIVRLLDALHQAATLLQQGDFARLLSYIAGADSSQIQSPANARIHTIDTEFAAQPPLPHEHHLGTFAFLMHPPTFEDLIGCEPPALRHFNLQQRENWENWLASWSRRSYDPGISYQLPALRSNQGGYVDGYLIACPLTPAQMMRLNKHDRAQLIKNYLDIARDLNVDMVGLGAFTSIITRSGTDVADCDLNVTTGNSLTAFASAESLKMVARERNLDLTSARAGIIGAAGSVGRLVSKNLARHCNGLTLFGNPNNPQSTSKLKALAGELYQDVLRLWLHQEPCGIARSLTHRLPSPSAIPYSLLMDSDPEIRIALFEHIEDLYRKSGQQPPILVTVDLTNHLASLPAVISATSHGQGFIEADLLAPGAIVCDVARPSDIAGKIGSQRADVICYEGGLMRLPEHIRLGTRNVLGLPPGINLACLSETIALTMSGARRNASIGTNVNYDAAAGIYAAAHAHGFNEVILDRQGNALFENVASPTQNFIQQQKVAS